MAIGGITFDSRIPTAKSQRATIAPLCTDGILAGCTCSGAGTRNFSIGGGYLVVGGGTVQLTSGGETVAVSGSSGYARIKGVIDLTGTSTSSSFTQFKFEADYSSTLGGFTALTQQNINAGSGTKYEAEIAILKLNSSGIESIVRTAKAMPKMQYGNSLPATAGAAGEIFLVKVG